MRFRKKKENLQKEEYKRYIQSQRVIFKFKYSIDKLITSLILIDIILCIRIFHRWKRFSFTLKDRISREGEREREKSWREWRDVWEGVDGIEGEDGARARVERGEGSWRRSGGRGLIRKISLSGSDKHTWPKHARHGRVQQRRVPSRVLASDN